MAWEIDKARTKLQFAVRHMMIHTVRGSFKDYEVELDIDPEQLENSAVRASISAQSVTTKDTMRDEYLASHHFFKPEQYPYITFESTSARLRGRTLSVSGKLKIRDIERQLILTGTTTGPTKSFGGSPRRLAFSLKGEIEREPYNLVFNGAVETVSIVVGKKVNLELTIELVET